MSVINILKSHNLEAFQEIDRMIESGITKIAAPRATGSGKTYLMGALAEKFNDENKIVLEPTKPLRDSIKDKFKEFGIENTDFMTYQKLIHMSDEDIAEMDYKVIFLDECHHGTAPVWGQKIGCLMATHSDSIVFGTSATVIRGDSVNVVETLFENNAIEELPLSTAIAKKILPVPTYVTAIYRLDDELEKLRKKVAAATNTKEEKQEFLEKIQYMKTHFEKSYGVPAILNKRIQEKSGRYLVFCKNKKHLDTMKDVVIGWFKTAGIKNIHSYAVYSEYPDREKDYKEFCADKSEAAKLMFSINVLNEGIHIKNIDGVLMIRPTMSDIVYRQQLGRVLEAGNLGKHPLVLDLVNNFSSTGDGMGLLKEIKDAVAKEKEGDPEFNDSGFEDIDTFFVLEQVVEIQEMFKEIEGGLQGRAWTEEEIEILKKWYPIEGIKVEDRLNGRTKSAIRNQVKELDLKAPDISWTEEENDILKKYYQTEGTKVENRLKGRTISAIKSQAEKLGLNIYKSWTAEENAILKKYYPVDGMKVVNRLEGRTKKAVEGQLKRLGLVVSNKWTDEENGILREWYPLEGTKVANRLNDRTKSAIRTQARRLDLKAPDISWTEEENEILKKYYPIEGKKVKNRLNGRTVCAIKLQTNKLGLRYKNKNKYKYVYKSKNKYTVAFRIDGKDVRFGTFDSEEEAAKVAIEKAKELGRVV